MSQPITRRPADAEFPARMFTTLDPEAIGQHLKLEPRDQTGVQRGDIAAEFGEAPPSMFLRWSTDEATR